jgi:glutamine cyclotransferase
MKHFVSLLLTAMVPLAFQSCGSGGGDTSSQKSNSEAPTQQTVVKHFDMHIANTDPESKGKCGDRFNVTFSDDGAVKADSVVLKVDGKVVSVLRSTSDPFVLETASLRCGVVPVSAQVCLQGDQSEYISKSLMLYSDIVPTRKTFKVLAAYPHDVEAYTQGLVFDNGVLYESTGLNRKSTLRKVNIANGDILQSYILDSQYFGEGLAMIDNMLYQLTWQSHVGFVYDKNTFNKIGEFSIGTEGWGLSALNNDTLVLTDGTENLYFMEPKGLSTIGKIQVCDNISVVTELNETELVDGVLMANIYRSNNIAEIDYHTGKVLSYIDFTGLLPDNLRTSSTDVLNGIAYDAAGKKLYVTGKNWPKLYNVKIIETK